MTNLATDRAMCQSPIPSSSSSSCTRNDTRTTFHFHDKQYRLADGDNQSSKIMFESTDLAPSVMSTATTFSDWSFYQELKQQPGCIHVELKQLHVEYGAWFLTGIQAV